MLLSSLILIPLLGIFSILSYNSFGLKENNKMLITIALSVTIIDLIVSLII
jgi:hypothetical protein